METGKSRAGEGGLGGAGLGAAGNKEGCNIK